MKRFFYTSILVITATFFSSIGFADEASDNAVVDSFLAHVAELDIANDEQKKAITALVTELRVESPSDSITEALIRLYPDYAGAIEASDDDDLASAKAELSKFVESENQFLSADASFYLARTLMNHEEFEMALPYLESLTDDLAEHTVHSGSAQFFIGVAQAGMLQNKEAIESFNVFLRENVNAPERLRMSAWRQAEHLARMSDGELDDVSQRMEFSRRRLAIEESNEKTQEEQDKIVDILNKLIEDAEKQEAQSSSKQNTQQQSEQQPGQPQPGQQANKPGQSKSDQGGTSSNPNGKAVRKSFDNGAQSAWSQLRDRARDPANTAAKEKLPAAYRDLVERYFEEANKVNEGG